MYICITDCYFVKILNSAVYDMSDRAMLVLGEASESDDEDVQQQVKPTLYNNIIINADIVY